MDERITCAALYLGGPKDGDCEEKTAMRQDVLVIAYEDGCDCYAAIRALYVEVNPGAWLDEDAATIKQYQFDIVSLYVWKKSHETIRKYRERIIAFYELQEEYRRGKQNARNA